jgi:tetratricopeptide (TPR) repeat protein
MGETMATNSDSMSTVETVVDRGGMGAAGSDDEASAQQPRPSLLSGPVGAEEPSVRIGRYTVIDHVGKGGMGEVLRAHDPELRREVALKLLYGDDETGPRTIGVHEARAMAQLSHPNVLPVYDVGKTRHDGRDITYIAMELVHGRSLRQWLDEQPRPWREVVRVFVEAGRGLAAVHAVGLVHRDFKPGNVLIGDDGRVRVMDFGIARALSHDTVPETWGSTSAVVDDSLATPGGYIKGTPPYMAPEQLEGASASPRSDQYSFCVSLWEGVYGERPFPLRKHAMAKAKRAGPPRSPASSGAPRWLHALLVRGLDPAPAHRFEDMQKLLDALDRATRPSRAWWLAGGMLVALAGGALVVANHSERSVCANAGAGLEGVWDPATRARVEQALLATDTPYSASTWANVAPALDRYADAWVALHTDACEATHVRKEQPESTMDARMRCLADRRRSLQAIVATLREPDAAAVERASAAVDGLPDVARCSDLDYVTAKVRPPDDPGTEARVEQLRDELARAQALQQAGRPTEGLEIARLVAAEAASLEYGPMVAEAALALGRLLRETGSYEQAAVELERAFFEGQRHDVHDVLTTAAIALIDAVGVKLHRHDEGRTWAEHAGVAVDTYGSPRERAALADNRANLASSLGDYDEAISHGEQALQLWDQAVGPDSLQVAGALSNLGVVYARRNQLDRAIDYLARAVEITEHRAGPDHPMLALRLNNLATLRMQEGKRDEALALLRRALEIYEAAYGAHHPEVAGTRLNIGRILGDLGHHDEAIEQIQLALRLLTETLGPDDADLAKPHFNLARVHAARGEHEAAIASYQRALELTEPNVPASHPHIGQILSVLGEQHLELGHHERAVPLLERSVAIFEDAGYDTPAWIDATRFLLARAWWDAGQRRAEAVELANRAREALVGADEDVSSVDAWLAAREHRARE